MDWMDSITKAITYIEENILEDITSSDVAKEVYISPFYFDKGFSMLCGMSVSEYIKNRRLALAGNELLIGDKKVIDIALKYGYSSPDSFTKAFTRFHGVTPSSVKAGEKGLKTFTPLKVTISLEGGLIMDYKIVKKESFKILGCKRSFSYENAKEVVPKFWKEFYQTKNAQYVCGKYGINIDLAMGNNTFDYLISDDYNGGDIPDGLVVEEIPALTWAIFPCVGPMPKALQDVNKKIFSEWLPALKDYEFAMGYCVEMYGDPRNYPNGTLDDNYYCEIWIPVKKK